MQLILLVKIPEEIGVTLDVILIGMMYGASQYLFRTGYYTTFARRTAQSISLGS